MDCSSFSRIELRSTSSIDSKRARSDLSVEISNCAGETGREWAEDGDGCLASKYDGEEAHGEIGW